MNGVVLRPLSNTQIMYYENSINNIDMGFISDRQHKPGTFHYELMTSERIMNVTETILEEDTGFIGVMYPVYTTLAPLIFVIVILMLLFFIVLLTIK